MGLEGLPITDGEVVDFDAVRAVMLSVGDLGALVVVWVVTVFLAALAIWARAVVLGGLALIAFAIATWWTWGKCRSHAAAVRQMRRADARDRAEGQS